MLISVSSLSPLSGPKAYAASPSTKSHPANTKAGAHCKSDQTPTKVGGNGPNKNKWYCKDNPQQGVGQAQGQGSPGPTTPCNKDAGCDLIETYVNPLVNLLSVAFGLIAVISLIMGGIQYSASQGDPQKSAQAKSRITNTLIAIFAYLFLYAFLQFLIPGGLFH
jgi:hypothetical protein